MNGFRSVDSAAWAGEVLRERGMRSTPQRRAILTAFQGGSAEHLSADEVYARAAESLPDLSRGTVYATLAEFSEAGLLVAYGSPEPVRYEINTQEHAHFRCRLCLRLFDVDLQPPDPGPFERQGYKVERMDLRADGVCKDCADYEAGLEAGVRAIRRSGASSKVVGDPGATAAEMDSPLGPLMVAATPTGVVRLAFAEHGDVDSLQALASRPRRNRQAVAHLHRAGADLARYFGAEPFEPQCPIDWNALAHADPLRATLDIPYGTRRSYAQLEAEPPARDLGRILGANPIPILTPCHRVTRGTEMPVGYVGGTERRAWLLRHEREQAG